MTHPIDMSGLKVQARLIDRFSGHLYTYVPPQGGGPPNLSGGIEVSGTVLPERPVYAYACGHNACDNVIFLGRLIDTEGQYKVYAFASECCEKLPIPDFVEQEEWPPFGVPEQIEARLCVGVNCDSAHDKRITLEYQGNGVWSGVFDMAGGQLTIEVDRKLGWRLRLGGCAKGPSWLPDECREFIDLSPVRTCVFPLLLVYDTSVVNFDFTSIRSLQWCCGGCGYFIIDIRGFCLPTKLARRIDRISGKDVYAYVECCESDCQKNYACCGQSPPNPNADVFLTVFCASGPQTFVVVRLRPFFPPPIIPPDPCALQEHRCGDWRAEPPDVWCQDGSEVPVSIGLTCSAVRNSIWTLTIQYAGVTVFLEATQVSCSPFRLEFSDGTYVINQ